MRKVKENRLPFRQTMSLNWFMIKLVFRTSPVYGCMLIFEALRRQGCNFIEHTIGIGFILEAVEFGYSFDRVLRFMIMMFLLMAFSGLYSAVFNSVVTPMVMPKLERELKLMLYDKAQQQDLACYDNAEYYNEFVMAVSEAKTALTRTTDFINMIATALVIFFSYGIYYITKDPIAVIFITISFVARFFAIMAVTRVRFGVRLRVNPSMKKKSYLHRVFYLADYAKELRLNPGMKEPLLHSYDKVVDEIYEENRKVGKKLGFLYFMIDYLFSDFIMDVCLLGYLVYQATSGTISYGLMVVLYNSAGGLRRGMKQLTELFPYASETALYVDKIMKFLDYKTKITSRKGLPMKSEPAEIVMENVGFAYETGKQVLKNINITLKPYEKLALVGYNGAGKTTLVKLLMRLYDPTEGRILVNGTDIRDFDVTAYREWIGTVFQDYCLYACAVKENVVMDIADEVSNETCENALKLAGFGEKLADLESGVMTHLTKEFEETGTNLSGGESQKVAIARVLYKDCSLIILDEPSSALDPIAEYKLNHTMTDAAKQKSVVFISHRLSTTCHADHIYMLENGQVIEDGTHEQMLAMNGKYASMWEAQASKYQLADGRS